MDGHSSDGEDHPHPGPERPSRRSWSARRAAVATAAVGTAFTAALASNRSVAPGQYLPEVRTILETSIVLISTLVAILAWGRYRLRRHTVDLALVGVVTFVWVLQPAWQAVGAALNGHEGSVWAPILARLIGALVLASATSWPHPGQPSQWEAPMRFSVGCADAVATAGACTASAGVVAFTALFGSAEVPSPTAPLVEGLGRWPVFESMEILSAAAFFVAAWALARRADAADDPFVTWVGLACVLDGLVSVNYALFPTISTAWLYTGDYFRVLAIGAWAVAGCHEIARYQAETARLTRVEERRRIARDLHDGLAQDLAYLSSRAKLLMSSAAADPASLADIATTSERALQESRRAVLSLTRPTSVPLDADLANTAREATRGYPTRVRVFVDPGLRVDPDRREALVSIVREAVNNASRHGRARTATVELSPSTSGMVLRVTDDGSGFDSVSLQRSPLGLQRNGFGLLSMEERSRAAGARFALSSAPGSGTTVQVEWPW